jgi:hypothetical protein
VTERAIGAVFRVVFSVFGAIALIVMFIGAWDAAGGLMAIAAVNVLLAVFFVELGESLIRRSDRKESRR